MVSVVQPTGSEAPAEAGYFSSGYSSVEDFLAAMKRFDLWLFEPNPAASIDSGVISCTQKERREGKRGLFWWLLESVGKKPVDYFEFGVMDGRTFDRTIEWTANRNARFYGFDTFEGLPEPWVRQTGGKAVRMVRDKGELSPSDAPAVYDDRALFFKGTFQETLPDALHHAFPNGRDSSRPLFLNIDSDLYTSALYVLASMHPMLRSGDYVYFDEFFDAMNEFSAFNDYIRAFNAKTWFVPVARAYDGVLFQIAMPSAEHAPEILDRRSTHLIARMRAYARARLLVLKWKSQGIRRAAAAESAED